jgi:hypothetical protein
MGANRGASQRSRGRECNTKRERVPGSIRKVWKMLSLPSPILGLLTYRSLHNQFSQMRMASNQHPRFLQQLRLASLDCLTYKLYTLHSRLGALQREVEVPMIFSPLISLAQLKESLR